MPPIPIFCGDCNARGVVNRVTAGLRCQCGSTNLGLEGVDPKPSRVVAARTAGYTHEDLYAIERRDPNGSEDRTSAPTASDLAAHKEWAVGKYGQEAWDRYKRGGWARSGDDSHYGSVANRWNAADPEHGSAEQQDEYAGGRPAMRPADMSVYKTQAERDEDERQQRESSQRVAYPQDPGTGWGKDMPSPTRGWSDYQGPIPSTVPRSAPVNDANVCPACHGTGYDMLDKTRCRECNGSGTVTGEHPTSRPNTESFDATTQGPASGGARWQGTAALTVTPPIPTWTGSNGNTANITFTPTVALEQKLTRAPIVGEYRMHDASCPNCKTASTELRKDRNQDGWWVCAGCGPLVNLDRYPQVDPFAPPQGFRPDRSMKTSRLIGRSRNTGRLFTMLATIHDTNDLTDREALSLARKTIATYAEEQ